MLLKQIKKELNKYSSPERKKANESFFKTGKGEYGEGDIFIGVRVPDLRKIAEQFSASISDQIQKNDFSVLEKLISSKIHEERFLALIFLVNFFPTYPVSNKPVSNNPVRRTQIGSKISAFVF